MTANALNIAAPNAAALKAGGSKAGVSALGAANAAGKASGPLAGFEALLATLFPQADPTAAIAPAGAQATAAGGLAANADALAHDGSIGDDGKGQADADPDALAAAAAAAANPDAGLAVCMIAIPVPGPQLTLKAPQGEALQGGPLSGRLQPLVPFSAGQALASRPGKGELAPEAAEAAEAGLDPTPLDPAAITKGDASGAKPAPQRTVAASFAAPPAVEAQVAAKAVAAKADGPEPDAAPSALIAAQTETPASVLAASLAPPPRNAAAQASTPAPKTPKAERAKAGADTVALDDAKAPTGAAKPATARAATAAAKPGSADGEAADGRAASSKAGPDQPEATLNLETRATTQALAPTSHGAHAVRGAPETVANLAAQILKKLEGQSTRFDLELHPADLGKVNVRLEIGAQGALTAAMSFDNPQAAAELRGRAAELQKALEQAGFNLAGGLTFDVAGDRGQQQQPGQSWQDQGEAAGRAFRGQAFRAALDTAGDANEAATNGALRLRRGVTAGLDVRI